MPDAVDRHQWLRRREGALTAWLRDTYSVGGDLRALPGELDHNVHVDGGGDAQHLLKVMREGCAPEFVTPLTNGDALARVGSYKRLIVAKTCQRDMTNLSSRSMEKPSIEGPAIGSASPQGASVSRKQFLVGLFATQSEPLRKPPLVTQLRRLQETGSQCEG